MSLRLACLEIWTPHRLRRSLLDELVVRVATAFGCPPPSWRARAYDARLREFAAFTAREAEAAPADERSRLEEALRRGAEELGRELRRRMGVETGDEARRAMTLLYRHIGIVARIGADGEVLVEECFFSGCYSPGVCRLMCAVDDGVAAGLSAGGSLTFQRRLTEGATACRGSFALPGGRGRADEGRAAARGGRKGMESAVS